MSNPEFDWINILPEEERKTVLANRQAFFDSFPTKEEVEHAGREGREAFFKACAQVDRARIADLTAELRKLQDIIDSQADLIIEYRETTARNLIYQVEKQEATCHCGKNGHALNSINCPVHGRNASREGEVNLIKQVLSEFDLDGTSGSYEEELSKAATAIYAALSRSRAGNET